MASTTKKVIAVVSSFIGTTIVVSIITNVLTRLNVKENSGRNQIEAHHESEPEVPHKEGD